MLTIEFGDIVLPLTTYEQKQALLTYMSTIVCSKQPSTVMSVVVGSSALEGVYLLFESLRLAANALCHH